MFILMAGYPYSGKSTYVRKLASEMTSELTIVNPKDFYTEDYAEVDDEKRSDIAISAWEVALEFTEECLGREDDAAAIALDTCGNNGNWVRSLIKRARRCGHAVAVIFIETSYNVCVDRWKEDCDRDKDYKSIMQRYLDNFKDLLPWLRDEADFFSIEASDKISDEVLKFVESQVIADADV